MAETAELEESMRRMMQQLPQPKVGQCRDCRQFRFWIWCSDSSGLCDKCIKIRGDKNKRTHELDMARIQEQHKVEQARILRESELQHEREEAKSRRQHEASEADKKRSEDESRRQHETREAEKKRKDDEKRRWHEASEADKKRKHEEGESKQQLEIQKLKLEQLREGKEFLKELRSLDPDRLSFAMRVLNTFGVIPNGVSTGIQEVGGIDENVENLNRQMSRHVH